MMPWIRAESQSEVLLSTSRTTSTPILVDFCRAVWRTTRIEVGVSKYIEVGRPQADWMMAGRVCRRREVPLDHVSENPGDELDCREGRGPLTPPKL